MTAENLLVVEAHSDDSAISISGFLERNRGRYRYHFVLVALSSVHLHHAGLVSRELRQQEYQRYVDHFDGVWHRECGLPFDADGLLDKMGKKTLVSAIENVIAEVSPAVLICQGPSFHQDHTMVYEATIAATRPTARFLPKEIYIMENPTYVHSLGPHTDMKPDLYVSLSEHDMQKKLDCYRAFFPTQVRDSVNYLSGDGIRAWARYRGIEARCTYAEALTTYIRIIL